MLQCCRLSLRWTWNELTRVWKSPNTSKREKISVTAEEAEETKKKKKYNRIQKKKPIKTAELCIVVEKPCCSVWLADHSDTDPLFSVVPGINQTFRVGVWWLKKWWLNNWPQDCLQSCSSCGLFQGSEYADGSGCPGWTPVHWGKVHESWTHRATEGHGPSCHVSGPEGFAANLLVWDTTAHLCGQEEGFFNATAAGGCSQCCLIDVEAVLTADRAIAPRLQQRPSFRLHFLFCYLGMTKRESFLSFSSVTLDWFISFPFVFPVRIWTHGGAVSLLCPYQWHLTL